MALDSPSSLRYKGSSAAGMARAAIRRIITMAIKTQSKYTPAMEQMIADAAPLNQARAQDLAELFGPDFTDKSVTQKAIRMGVAYERKQPVSKTGAPIEKKEAIVADIESFVGSTLAGLEKAPKPALQALRNFLAA